MAETRKGRRAVRTLGGLFFSVAALLVVLLIFFRPASCRTLGGFWTPRGHCSGEFGGNGTNG